MADQPLFTLDAAGRWRLSCDSLQWIVQRRVGSVRRSKGAGVRDTGWRGTDYIASEKRILHRCIAERGVVLTVDAQARLDALPERFRDFTAPASAAPRSAAA